MSKEKVKLFLKCCKDGIECSDFNCLLYLVNEANQPHFVCQRALGLAIQQNHCKIVERILKTCQQDFDFSPFLELCFEEDKSSILKIFLQDGRCRVKNHFYTELPRFFYNAKTTKNIEMAIELIRLMLKNKNSRPGTTENFALTSIFWIDALSENQQFELAKMFLKNKDVIESKIKVRLCNLKEAKNFFKHISACNLFDQCTGSWIYQPIKNGCIHDNGTFIINPIGRRDCIKTRIKYILKDTVSMCLALTSLQLPVLLVLYLLESTMEPFFAFQSFFHLWRVGETVKNANFDSNNLTDFPQKSQVLQVGKRLCQ